MILVQFVIHIRGTFIKIRVTKFYLNAYQELCEAYEAHFNCLFVSNGKRYLEGKQFLVKEYILNYKWMFITCSCLSLFITGWYRDEKWSMKFTVSRNLLGQKIIITFIHLKDVKAKM